MNGTVSKVKDGLLNWLIRYIFSSVIVKLLTKIYQQRISEVLEEENILHDSQYGFRPGRGTTDALLLVNTIIAKCKQAKRPVFLGFIDLQKAYNKGQLLNILMKGTLFYVFSYLQLFNIKLHGDKMKNNFLTPKFKLKTCLRNTHETAFNILAPHKIDPL